VLAVLFSVGLGMALVFACLADDWPGLFLNLGTEIMGAVPIYLILDRLIGNWDRREAAAKALEARKKDLIAQMGSKVHDVAIEAVKDLRKEGWLTDGSLRGAFLWYAELQGAPLRDADLQGVRLRFANLQGAILEIGKLQGADLTLADLEGANLFAAKLQGASLRGATLLNADLQHATFDENTRLPDATNWTPDTDMARFTDPQHPAFWRSDEPGSPACQPKEQE